MRCAFEPRCRRPYPDAGDGIAIVGGALGEEGRRLRSTARGGAGIGALRSASVMKDATPVAKTVCALLSDVAAGDHG